MHNAPGVTTFKEHLLEIMETIEANHRMIKAPGLDNGLAGIGLLYGYYGSAFGDLEYKDKALDMLERALAGFDDDPDAGFSFASGLSGILWVIQHLNKNGIIALDASELLIDTDHLIFEWASTCLKRREFDYLSAGLGGVLYLFERLPSLTVDSYLRELLRILLSDVSKLKNGWAWVRAGEDNKAYNLTVAHGQISIVAVLTLYYKYNIESGQVKNAAINICNFISHYVSISEPLKTISSVVSVHTDEPALGNHNLAWCNGNLGASVVLFNAGSVFKDQQMKSVSRALMINSITILYKDDLLIRDGCLCHGYAGVAYLYHKWMQVSDSPVVKEAYVYAANMLSTYTTRSQNWAACKFWLGEDYGWQTCWGVFDGLSGVALSLLTQISKRNRASAWDRMLLLD
jgi:lantibiotic modifying enzyme